jgi:hypothetical protein
MGLVVAGMDQNRVRAISCGQVGRSARRTYDRSYQEDSRCEQPAQR